MQISKWSMAPLAVAVTFGSKSAPPLSVFRLVTA